MFQGLMVNLEKYDELKSWLKGTYDGVLLYVTSGNGLTYDDKIVTDVLKPLYLKL
jgi:hypothetical protein